MKEKWSFPVDRGLAVWCEGVKIVKSYDHAADGRVDMPSMVSA